VPEESTSQKPVLSLAPIHCTGAPTGRSARTAPRVPGSLRRFTSAALIQRSRTASSAAATWSALVRESAAKRNDRPGRERMAVGSKPG
jgi:hypothetical protein